MAIQLPKIEQHESIGELSELARRLRAVARQHEDFFQNQFQRLASHMRQQQDLIAQASVVQRMIDDMQQQKSAWESQRDSELSRIAAASDKLVAAWEELEHQQREFLIQKQTCNTGPNLQQQNILDADRILRQVETKIQQRPSNGISSTHQPVTSHAPQMQGSAMQVNPAIQNENPTSSSTHAYPDSQIIPQQTGSAQNTFETATLRQASQNPMGTVKEPEKPSQFEQAQLQRQMRQHAKKNH